MVAINSVGLPAHIQGKTKTTNLFAAAVSVGGFPVISIKGKVFHIQRGDVRELVTKTGTDDEPAPSLEVVILSVNPNKSKVYYNTGFIEGSVAKPTCYSNNGVSPAEDAEDSSLRNVMFALITNGVHALQIAVVRVKPVVTLCVYV